MLESIIKVKDKVEFLLTSKPIFRDDDNKLIAKIWHAETQSNSLIDFLLEFGDHKLSSPEAIRRARQKLQEDNPSLRGLLYAKRHKNAAKTKSNINYVNY